MLSGPPDPSRANVRARWAVSAAFFANGATFASFAPHIPAVKGALGLSEGRLGLALLAGAAGAVAAMPAAGGLADRVGSRAVVVVGGLLYAALLPLPLLASSFGVLVAVLFMWGASGGAMDVAMNAHAVAVERRLGRPIFSSVHGFWSVGALAGAAAASAGLARGLPPLALVVGAAVGLGAVVAVAAPALLPRSAEPRHAPSDEPAVPMHRLLRGPLLGLGVLAGAVMMAEGAMADWTALYLRDTLGASPALGAAGYTAFALAMTVGRFGGDWISAHVGRTALVRGGTALAALGLFAAVAAGHPLVAAAGFGLVGLGLSNAVPALFGAAGAVAGKTPGRALAAVTTVGYGGLLGGPPLIGFLAEAVTLGRALAIVAGMLLVVALVAPRVVRSA